MMQLTRRASLVVVLVLLTSVGTACPECAWVLWSHGLVAGENVYDVDSAASIATFGEIVRV